MRLWRLNPLRLHIYFSDYTIGRRCPRGHRPKMPISAFLERTPARASTSNSINTPMKAKVLSGFVPKGPSGVFEACIWDQARNGFDVQCGVYENFHSMIMFFVMSII